MRPDPLPRRDVDEPDDWSLPALASLVAGLADLGDVSADRDGALHMAELSLRTPIELDLSIADDGTVTALAGSTPTQRIETTVMPVFHTLRVRIARSDRE
jgi:hypothetical protein